jgi:hypothetical protein
MSICSGNRRSSPPSDIDIVDINIFRRNYTVHQTTDMVSIRFLSPAGQICRKKILYVLVYIQYCTDSKSTNNAPVNDLMKIGQKVAEVRTTKLRKLL